VTSARAQNRTTRRSAFQRYDDKLNNSPPSLATCHQKALAANYQSRCQMTGRGSIADLPPPSLPRSRSLFLFIFLSPSCTLPLKQYCLDLATPWQPNILRSIYLSSFADSSSIYSARTPLLVSHLLPQLPLFKYPPHSRPPAYRSETSTRRLKAHGHVYSHPLVACRKRINQSSLS